MEEYENNMNELGKNNGKHTRNVKKIVLVIPLLVLLFSLSSCALIYNTEFMKQRDELIVRIASLEYQALEYDGEIFYPIKIPLYWVMVSLPPEGEAKVHKVIDGKTDYSNEYIALGFIDDIDDSLLYFDEVVFEKKIDKSKLSELDLE